MISRSLLLALVLSSCVAAEGASPTPGTPSSTALPAAEVPDFGPERLRLESAQASLERVDYSDARAGASEVIDALLARPAAEQDEAWLLLLEEAGRVARKAQDMRVANRAFARVLEIRERTLHADDLALQSARVDLAGTLRGLGDPAAARALEEQAVEVLSRTLPDDHAELQRARHGLGISLRALGQLQAALVLYEQVFAVNSRTLPDDHPDLQSIRMNLAAAVKELGDLARARALEEKVLEVRTRTLPEDHPSLQRIRSNLASTLVSLRDLQGARPLLEKVAESLARTLPEDHPDLQTANLNLSVLLYFLGEYPAARALQEQVLAVRSRILPEEHMDLQLARLNLSATLNELGDHSGARVLKERVLEVFSRTLPDDHPHLQTARQSLAVTAGALRDYDQARALEEKVLEVLSGRLPDGHPDLLKAKASLASTLWHLEDYAGARELEEEVLDARLLALGEEHPDVQAARASLATTLHSLGDLAGARALEEEVLEVRSRILPTGHPEIQSARRNLAVTILYETAGLREEERARAREAARNRVVDLLRDQCLDEASGALQVLRTAPSREAEERCASLARALDVTFSASLGFGVLDPLRELWPDALVLSEATRNGGLVARAIARRNSSTPRHAELRERLRAATADLAAQAQNGTTTEEYQVARVRRESIERELLELGDRSSGDRFGFERLSSALGPGATAVAYRRYHGFTLGAPPQGEASVPAIPALTSEPSLCAFVVRGSSPGESLPPLALIDLGPLAPIESAIEAWREGLGVGAGRGVAAAPRDETQDLEARGVALRRLVLDPLRSAIADAERLIVVLDAGLHLVPLDALPAEEAGGRLLGEIVRIENRATLVELLDPPAPFLGGSELLALGGASFGGEPGAAHAVAAVLRGGAWANGFEPLPGTLEEIEGLSSLFAEAAGPSAVSTILREEGATRQALVEAAPKARWMHLATHGWYASESIRSWSDPEPLDRQMGLLTRASGEEQIRGMSPMLLCGLALAGANLAGEGRGRASALATAEELSTLDLSNCELAVLSACDTNLGVVRAGQGVASLQKALQMAGARSVITSLWKVPDQATQELMVDFYRRLWIERKPKAQALWEAKMALRDARDEHGRARHRTRDWAAWVLTGDPR